MSTYDDAMDTSPDKGKGKAEDPLTADPEEVEEEESSDEEVVDEQAIPADAEEDDLEEIDTDNIVPGRTRGKVIDYSQVDQSGLVDDDDDDDDDDFQDKPAPEEVDPDRMEH
ncbi:hypothetical protein ABW19_dt0206466 [Dactylella cylindrospora]|nr:hypothetical protein ABW19_dt0206466 [Dactylella cylindrospora]